MFFNQLIDHCDSTQNYVKRGATLGLPNGTWIASKIQTAGRGRLDRKWESMEGNLHLSILFRDIPLENRTWIPLLAGLAVMKSIEKCTGLCAIKLKWPNDLLVNKKKLGGILCEGTQEFIIVGIGLNLIAAPENGATSLHDEGYPVELSVLLQEILTQSKAIVSRISAVSPVEIHREFSGVFLERSFLKSGDIVKIKNSKWRVKNLGIYGELIVEQETQSGWVAHHLYAEEIRVEDRLKDDEFLGG